MTTLRSSRWRILPRRSCPSFRCARNSPPAAGSLDNLWVTPDGGIVLGECKLFRNPEARRQVIVQALDYARAIAGLEYEELEAAVRKALGSPSVRCGPWSAAKARSTSSIRRRGLQETAPKPFHGLDHRRRHSGRSRVADQLPSAPRGASRRTRSGRPVNLARRRRPVAGSAENTAAYGAGRARSRNGRTVRRSQGSTSQPSSGIAVKRLPSPFTISEQEYFDQLEQRRPGVERKLRSFCGRSRALGVVPEFRKSLVLRWNASPDFDASPGYIDTVGLSG